MDNSETYIKMCEKAEEIQEIKRCPKSDIHYCGKDNILPGDVFYCKGSMSGDYYVGPDFEEGDIFVSGEVSAVSMDYPDCRVREDGSRYSYDDAPLIFLPRQDQLQEMIRFEVDRRGGIQIEPVQLLNRFGVFCEEILRNKNHTERFLSSMEQLWLAFVMKEKYNKVWDGEGWT